MWGWRSGRTIALSAAGAAFAAFSVLPLISIVAALIPERTTWSLLGPLFDSRQRGLLLNTGLLGTGTAVASTLLGLPLGIALARATLPFKSALRVLLAAPALFPSYVVGLAWLDLAEWPRNWSLTGAVTVLTLVLYPLSMLAVEAALRGIEPRLEEAASLVAKPNRTLWRITLPLILPQILAAALIVFVLAISDFGVPASLRVRVFTTEIFTAFAAQYDTARATALTVPLLLVSLFVSVIVVSWTADRLVATRRGSQGKPVMIERWRRPAVGLIACAVPIALGLPIATLLNEARQVDSWVALMAGSGDAVRNSLTLAAVGATLVCAVAIWLGYATARMRRTPAIAMDALFIVLFAVPATITGVALIELWNRPDLAGTVYATNGMFVLVYLARFTPLAALVLAAGFKRVPPSQEEAAAVSGIGWMSTMVGVVLPQVKLELGLTWVIVFALAFGELGASVLVTPPGESTLPVRTYTLIANAPRSHVAALALAQVGVVFVPLALISLGLALRRER
jgi:iron(III) transport system permease protein